MFKIFKRDYRICLLCLTFIVLGVSIYVHQVESYLIYRGIRALVIFSALVYLLIRKPNVLKPWMAIFLVLYGASSTLTIWYEHEYFATLSMLLNLLAFWAIILMLIPKVNIKKMNRGYTVLFVILILFNAYLLYEFVHMMKDEAFNNYHYLLMMFGAMSLAIAAFFALVFNHLHTSKLSIVFTIFVFLLIFAEIFRGIAYYDFAYGDIAVYIARFLNISSMALFLHFAILNWVNRRTKAINI